MSLRIYNTLTRQKEPFAPLIPGQVGMYVCGVTPYDVSHIGHARSALVFDVIARYLRYCRYRVTVVKNYTDVDDKIIARANQLGVPIDELAERYIKAYQDDMAKLGVEPPTKDPRATRHVPQMIDLIERLVAAGVAYALDGDVYFEVRRFPAYGCLSGKNLEELLAGARVEVDERKRDPRDFALWKAAKPGEPSWSSPWGPGRPGWHIECSAMAMYYLGATVDLHGGGEDLVFPHHECEIAQSEAATGRPFSRYWLHNGFVNLGSAKMSKSLGNVLTIDGLLRRHDPEALRLYLLQTHYRHPVEFAEARIGEAARGLERLQGLVDLASEVSPTGPDANPELSSAPVETRNRFQAAMDDDFNTPQALSVLFEFSNRLYAWRDVVRRPARPARLLREGVDALWEMAAVLGFKKRGRWVDPLLPVQADPLLGTQPQVGSINWVSAIDRLVKERDEARRSMDWKRADTLRDEIEANGAIVEDTPAGPRWKPKTTPTAH